MAKVDIRLQAVPALVLGDSPSDTRLSVVEGLDLVSVAVPQGGQTALAKRLKALWGLDWPEPGRATGAQALWMTPDQVMLVLPQGQGAQAMSDLGALAYTTDQSDAWVALELAGPGCGAAMERLCALDFATMEPGACARTAIGHLGGIVWRKGPHAVWLMGPRSAAQSLVDDIETVLANIAALPRPSA